MPVEFRLKTVGPLLWEGESAQRLGHAFVAAIGIFGGPEAVRRAGMA